MNKKRAKFNFILTSLLVVLAIFLCIAQFKMPFSNSNFKGFFNSIVATNDITSGYSAVYEVTSEDVSSKELADTVYKIRDILEDQGFSNPKVYVQGKGIRVEVDALSNASNILAIIGTSRTFFISTKDQETITEEELNSFDIVGTDINNAFSTTQVQLDEEYNGVTIEFNQDGKDKLKDMKESLNGNGNVYFYIDGTKSTSLEIDGSQSDDNISFYFSNATSESAKEYALNILMASTGVSLKTISNATTTPLLGSNVVKLTMIACAIILIAIFLVLPIMFGQFGIVADLSILIGVVFNIFILQALPLTTSSIAGIIGTTISIGLMAICHVIYLKKIKSEFKVLNRLQLAVRTGFKKSWLANLDICVITFLSAISLAFWKIPFVSTFGISLAIGTFFALFNTVIIFKDFVTWYVWINPKDYKKVKFTKGEQHEK